MPISLSALVQTDTTSFRLPSYYVQNLSRIDRDLKRSLRIGGNGPIEDSNRPERRIIDEIEALFTALPRKTKLSPDLELCQKNLAALFSLGAALGVAKTKLNWALLRGLRRYAKMVLRCQTGTQTAFPPDTPPPELIMAAYVYYACLLLDDIQKLRTSRKVRFKPTEIAALLTKVYQLDDHYVSRLFGAFPSENKEIIKYFIRHYSTDAMESIKVFRKDNLLLKQQALQIALIILRGYGRSYPFILASVTKKLLKTRK